MNRLTLMLRRSCSWPQCNTCDLFLCSSCSTRNFTLFREPQPTMAGDIPRILLYILRRDVRLSDNPIFDAASRQINRQDPPTSKPISSSQDHDHSQLPSQQDGSNFTHLLPVYVFPSNQIEISGFLSSPSDKSPYPEARSHVAKVWRTGPHRAKFIGEGAWDLKKRLEGLRCGSGLELRVGRVADVVSNILEWYSQNNEKGQITGLWMTDDDGTEEKDDEKHIRKLTEQHKVDFKVWADAKYYVDEYVIPKRAVFIFNFGKQYTDSLQPRFTLPQYLRTT